MRIAGVTTTSSILSLGKEKMEGSYTLYTIKNDTDRNPNESNNKKAAIIRRACLFSTSLSHKSYKS
jgi:hypothetical protein